MARFQHKVVQGIGTAWVVQISGGGPYTGTEPLSCDVWPGDNQAVTFTPTATWYSAANKQILVTYSAANTTSVADGYYEVRIYQTDLSQAFGYGNLTVVASPGTTAASLTTVPYVRAALSDLTLSDTQLDFLPSAIQMASDVVRRYCARYFSRRTLTREYIPTYDGRVMLPEGPVNEILRVASDRTPALTISNTSSANQQARCYFATTGDRETGLVVTGLTLVRVSSGVATTNTLSFATYTTVSSLVTAINAVGSGWSATTQNSLGAWGTDQLVGGDTGQGCLTGGATLSVYANDVSGYNADFATGLVYLGNSTGGDSVMTPAWGPGWQAYLDYPTQPVSRVQITHDLGFDTIPASVQQATAEIAKAAVTRSATDETLRTETAEGYSYGLATMIEAMTPAVRQMLAQYRITNA